MLLCFQLSFLKIRIDRNFFFLVSLWLIFHFLIFFFRLIWNKSGVGPGPTFVSENFIRSESALAWADPLRNVTEFLKSEKKFLLKNIFLYVLWMCKLFWWEVWILYYIRPAIPSGKACISISVAAFLSRFR